MPPSRPAESPSEPRPTVRPSDLPTEVAEVAVAPDGERVAFVADEPDHERDERRRALFVVPADGSEPPHRLTRIAGARTVRWRPDGTQLGFVAARPTARGFGEDGDEPGVDDADETPAEQVHAFDLARGGDARQLTAFPEGVADYDWSPDGDRIVVAARDPTDEGVSSRADREAGEPRVVDRLQYQFDGEGWLDDVRTYLFVVDVDAGDRTAGTGGSGASVAPHGIDGARRLDDAYGGGAMEHAHGLQPAWSPAGDRIAFLSNRTPRPDDSLAMDVYTVAPDGSDCRRVTDGAVAASGVVWTPSGDALAFPASDPTDYYAPTELYAAPVDGGPTDNGSDSPDGVAGDDGVPDGPDGSDDRDDSDDPAGYRSVSAPLDRSVAAGRSAVATDDGTVLSPIEDEGRVRLARFPLDGSAPRRVDDGLDELVTLARDRRTVPGFDAAGGTVAAVLTGPDEPPEVYATPLSALDAGAGASDPFVRLPRLHDDRAGEGSPTARWVDVEGDGGALAALVLGPPDVELGSAAGLPLVVAIHGGPVSFDDPGYDVDDRVWTREGYLVCRVNYRGSSSYGRAHSRALAGGEGEREVADVLAAAESLVDRGWADPDRVFVTGFSYGGIVTGHLLADTDLATAGAAEHGTYDERSSFGTGDFHNAIEAKYGRPWAAPGRYEAVSSVARVDGIDAPLLLTAGGEDRRCPPTQSQQLYVSLRKRGVATRLVVYPDEHHAVSRPGRAIHRLETLVDWVREHDPGRDDVDGGSDPGAR